jgi:hypothetical protein
MHVEMDKSHLARKVRHDLSPIPEPLSSRYGARLSML